MEATLHTSRNQDTDVPVDVLAQIAAARRDLASLEMSLSRSLEIARRAQQNAVLRHSAIDQLIANLHAAEGDIRAAKREIEERRDALVSAAIMLGQEREAGLRAEVADLRAQVGALTGRVEELNPLEIPAALSSRPKISLRADQHRQFADDLEAALSASLSVHAATLKSGGGDAEV